MTLSQWYEPASKPQKQTNGSFQVCNRQIGPEAKSILACFTMHAKYMALSVLDTSLPMQRSHDTIAFGI